MHKADIIITDNTDLLKEASLNIIISDNVPECHVGISPNLPLEAILEAVKVTIKTYSISPRIDKIAILQEQNALLSEANKGLVELYNLIDNKNQQIVFLKNKLENIINSAGESIVEIDNNLNIVYANLKFSDTTGYKGDSWKSMKFLDLVHEDNKGLFCEKIKLVLQEKTANIEMKLKVENGAYITVNAYMTIIKNGEPHFEIIFEDISNKLLMEQHVKKLEEKAIVAGFSRHLSHNILNALTVAAGFMKKIRQETSANDTLEHKWNIIDMKCKLIEEIVTGYNDYTNAISLHLDDHFDMAEFMRQTVQELHEKNFSKNFSAFLYYFLDQYEVNPEFHIDASFNFKGSKMFLKMALCYIIKDSIRYFNEYTPLNFNIVVSSMNDRLSILIKLNNVDVPTSILDTMFQPWNHQILSQSFDYWGIVIANVIIERHGGVMNLRKENSGLSFIIEF
jgi:PAS domain S-box-containing protein